MNRKQETELAYKERRKQIEAGRSNRCLACGGQRKQVHIAVSDEFRTEEQKRLGKKRSINVIMCFESASPSLSVKRLERIASWFA